MKITSNLIPWTTTFAVGLQSISTLLKQLEVPRRRRHVVGTTRDSAPERLHVVDLIFDRKLVETRRRNGERLAHADYRSRTSEDGKATASQQSSLQSVTTPPEPTGSI